MYFILFFLFFIIICFLFYLLLIEKNKNKEILTLNEKIKKQNEEIEKNNINLINKKEYIQKDIEEKQKILNQMQQSITNAEDVSRKAFENYANILDIEYQVKEEEYEKALKLLNQSYENIQQQLIAETR